MRDRLKSRAAWPFAAWLVPLAFTALPNCTFQRSDGIVSNPTSAVFCDIEDKAVPRHCATAEDRMLGVPLQSAAVALINHQPTNIGLDFSPAAIAAFGCATTPTPQPVAITFIDRFPNGSPVCLDCEASIAPNGVYPDQHAVCVAQCERINGPDPTHPPTTPPPDVKAFCAAPEHVQLSTNTADGCIEGACTDAGALPDDFGDPRSTPEAVVWQDLVGVGVGNPDTNSLKRDLDTTPPSPGKFDAGAQSEETITHGDAYVEFTASEIGTARILGLSTGNPPTTSLSEADVSFGIRLSAGGFVLLSESGNLVPPPNEPDPMNPTFHFASFAEGDRLRVTVTDKLDNTATITYSLIPAVCPGGGCMPVDLHLSGPAAYPFRVVARIREKDATLKDVRVVRIK